MYEMERDLHTRVLRSEKGCMIRVTHVHTRSDCVHTRDDTVRLNYASQFVRFIYSSHIVSIKLGTATKRQKKKDKKEKNDRNKKRKKKCENTTSEQHSLDMSQSILNDKSVPAHAGFGESFKDQCGEGFHVNSC